MTIEPIAYYHGPFGSKFGIPRQGTLLEGVPGRVVFEDKYRIREALRGLDGFSHIWLIWGFSMNGGASGDWQPTVRPPRLGGNTRLGVFATRSPYRPNPLGLSCVKLEGVDGMELAVSGADLADGTPIFDIKPYLVYADSFPNASGGFVSGAPEAQLQVVVPEGIGLSEEQVSVLRKVLSQDPRPAYQDTPGREYAMPFCGADLYFIVKDNILTITRYKK